MNDLICRNTMMRCQTPGMCSPHGGCNPQAPVALTGNHELDQLRHDCEKWEALYRAEHASCTRVLDTLTGFRTERDQLKAQVEKFQVKKALCGLHEKASCLECMWPPPEKSEVAALKAEVEALRDDLEQIKYDANAWRNGEESVWIEVFHSDGDDPFISAITGQITVEQLGLIQAEILEYREDYFEKGSGLYVFRCSHCPAHHDNVGMTEPAHWETDFESYSPFPWEEEAEVMGKGEKA